jgi:hypothetical protein
LFPALSSAAVVTRIL